MYFGRKSYFLTVANTQNITKAAQLLHVSQPSLSQYLNRLEQELGVKLLDRSCSPIQLTEAGRIYLEYVKESAAVEKKFENNLERYKQRQSQTLSIGIPTQLTPLIFGSIVQNFIVNHPNIKLTIKGGTSLTLMRQLICEEVDIAFFHTKDREDDRFDRHVFVEEELFLVCNRDSPLVAGKTATRENPLVVSNTDLPVLESMRFLTLSKEYYLYQLMLEYIHEIGISPKETLEISHLDTIISYLQKPGNSSVSMLADFALCNTRNSDRLAFFKVAGHDLFWCVTMNRLSNMPVSQIAQQFWDESIKLRL